MRKIIGIFVALMLGTTLVGCSNGGGGMFGQKVPSPPPASRAPVVPVVTAAPQPVAKAPVVVASVAATPIPSAHPEWKWQHFGAAPYAATRAEAMKTRESAFRKMGLPAPVIAQFMRATEKPGEKTRLVMGDRLTTMLSKGGVVRHNVVVAFSKPPKGMEFAAPAEKWQVTHGGRTYTLILPEVCWNWSDIVASGPVVLAPAPQPVVSVGACPTGFELIANAWLLQSLPEPLRTRAVNYIADAESRDSDNARRLDAYTPSAISRTMGGQLRSQVKTRAPIIVDVQVRYLDPQTAMPVRELGSAKLVNGVGSFRFPNDPRAFVVETIWPPHFLSPTLSGGQRRLRVFPNEWGTWCSLNIHGILLP